MSASGKSRNLDCFEVAGMKFSMEGQQPTVFLPIRRWKFHMCGAAKGVSGHFMEVAELESILDEESILLQELVIMGEESIFLLKSSRVENDKIDVPVIWFLCHNAISSRYMICILLQVTYCEFPPPYLLFFIFFF